MALSFPGNGRSVYRSVGPWLTLGRSEIRKKITFSTSFLSLLISLSLSSKVYFSHSYSHYLTLSFSHNISHSILYFFLFHLSISPYTYLTLSTYVGVILSSHKFHSLILYPFLTLSLSIFFLSLHSFDQIFLFLTFWLDRMYFSLFQTGDGDYIQFSIILFTGWWRPASQWDQILRNFATMINFESFGPFLWGIIEHLNLLW